MERLKKVVFTSGTSDEPYFNDLRLKYGIK